MVNPGLSVIIPSYNEERRLGPRLSSVLKYLHTHFPDYELIIVDDGSTDDTVKMVSRAIVGEPRATLITYQKNMGKGYAVRKGVLASHGKQVLFMDADLSTPLSEIPKILKTLKNADVVIGSRGQLDAKIGKSQPFYRRLSSFIFDQIKFQMVGLRRFSDTQCGFKAFKGTVARRLFAQSRIDRFMFDVEILYLAEKFGMRIVETPVHWADMPDSKVRFWEGIINMFRDLRRIRHQHRDTP